MKRLILILALVATPLFAVEPDEVLSDPVLELRALELSKGLRCPVCQSESIDESNAPISKDLRLLVRERLVAGDSDQAALNYIVARYGEFVLLKPTFGGANWLLWAAGPLMLLLAGVVGVSYVRGRAGAKAPQDDALSADEAAALRDILNK
ncbi:cytochrome c-type biogenesis protein [Sulfitobacter guttiformis]|uniref:Cytochrome c-type biogenesis protein n=1 Tax=Sulfitobacter guttiformis TaxID=74349 RepID=A0A420DMV2_9RHOB|nr:cytochrome c-type biogenesis protein [Sulfitobacter guttiformis]KIN72925.1 Cytochrome c biogenesis family protein [Sulfitobacter guttiformis KCTC 32187]RKE95614.1 cytochrome c-type biogenesis protein CcmH [Sulfitobacter guttiformis]